MTSDKSTHRSYVAIYPETIKALNPQPLLPTAVAAHPVLSRKAQRRKMRSMPITSPASRYVRQEGSGAGFRFFLGLGFRGLRFRV